MSIFLYQIGMDRITVNPTSFAGLQINLPRSFKTSVTQGVGSPKVLFNGFTQFPEPMELEVTGTFLCSRCESVADQYGKLLSMSGKPYVDVIGYLPNDCCGVGESCDVCGNCQGDKAVTWMTTTGTITSVDRHYTISGDSEYPGNMMEVSFKMTLDTYWYPMNPYVWYPHYDLSTPYDSFRREKILTKSILPTKVDNRSRFSFFKRIYESPHALLTPEIFPLIYRAEDGYGKSFFKLPDGKFRYRVRPARTRWAAAPTSIYVFKFPVDVPINTFVPKITVESEIAPYYTQTFVSTGNIIATDDIVLDSPLQFYVVIADGVYGPVYAAPIPPFTAENYPYQTEERIGELTGTWDYSTNYPGELVGVDNFVTIEAHPDVEVAFLHIFRGL